ncbi:MAG: hypothetical protein KDA92_26920, partial [Planctomycetales bacterium]|nr:hypothetical protein [Planctomycetales bacterium]
LILVIEEQHPAGSKAFPLWLRVRPQPDEARHTWIADALRARHEYIFHDASRVLLSKPQLDVTTFEQLEETWLDSGPLPVELPHR